MVVVAGGDCWSVGLARRRAGSLGTQGAVGVHRAVEPRRGLGRHLPHDAGVLQKAGITKETMYVTNMPGGSGAVAVANVITKRKGDTNLLVAASNSLTLTIALKRTAHTYNDVIPLAQVGAEMGGFFVKADSPYKTLTDLANALKKDPKAASFAGGSAPGSLDHIKAAVFAKAIGVDATKVSYVPFQGGGEAMTSLLGGHTNVAALDLSEAAGQLEAGKVRCLALLSDKRSTKFKDIPTSYEQNVKATFPIWRGLYMAPGVPAEAVQFWSGAIQKMTTTAEWNTNRERSAGSRCTSSATTSGSS